MFPFWKPAVLPLLRSASATRIVEIGALRGENTDLMLADLDDDVELHVIDPLPEFDPAVHEAAWPKRYVFHRALSLDVLSSLPPMDAALIDGDHNWYTVRNELQQLTDVATAAGRPMPMMILHDVGWPYGRRDLYYDPGNIPDEFRQPYRRAGMLPGRSDLVDNGGLNPDMANATHEGGERNGVMTVVDDFVSDHPEPIRVVFLPVYFGLAILVEEAVVERTPKLQWHLDRLEGLREKTSSWRSPSALGCGRWSSSTPRSSGRTVVTTNSRVVSATSRSGRSATTPTGSASSGRRCRMPRGVPTSQCSGSNRPSCCSSP